ncbi:MAG TPA: methyltransferase [Fibrobacteraceae bacterium]|nr:methyltransferase [Fibrobacteraceae bacterium]
MPDTFYQEDPRSAIEAQRLAQEVAFAPVVFQVSRLMVKFGILEMLFQAKKDGLEMAEIVQRTGLTRYAVQCLLESSLSIGLCTEKNRIFQIAKAGVYLLQDPMTRVNMDFIHDVCYQGLFHLEEALQKGRPAGLRTLGNWSTVYEGLSCLPKTVQQSWFAFDHFYSNNFFPEALRIVFSRPVQTLLDIGGNTGLWASQCVQYSKEVHVTIMDLPQQLEVMRKATSTVPGHDRIHGFAGNLLDDSVLPPSGFEVIWMSQFLDCFSEAEATSILRRVAASMGPQSRVYIAETFWNRQRFETAAYCLNQISLYFTAIANGNSKMYHSDDLERCVQNAGLVVEQLHDELGLGHSLMVCRRKILGA